MARESRKLVDNATYLVTNKSNPELLLFGEEDLKIKFMNILEKNVEKFDVEIISYVLMSNHFHIQLKIESELLKKFMLCVQTAIAKFFNKKYKRRGKVFIDRYHSEAILEENVEGNIKVSNYIHRNPHKIYGFKNREEFYKWSSLGVYKKIEKNTFNLIKFSFLKKIFVVKSINQVCKKYIKLFEEYRCNKEKIE